MPDAKSETSAPEDPASYTVVARRYRPKSFDELVGQDHIGQALTKAIATGRVGHAYLFTGARGVGKTSSARIFAKALNAPASRAATGGKASAQVADDDDVAQAIDAGEDVDVIEIDAASNRGIDEIRQLRANVSVRPSRSRYKIYIIDEVHMLTNAAFNALLKTLEEPPEHVKFIFCTTDPEKVPITVLSRCQRFDFAPVQPDAIKQRLIEICAAEGFKADDDALALLARRAAGSMRDSQSLLEQVMSFSTDTITVEQVHDLLGTADESRLREMAQALAQRDGVAALQLVEKALSEGTDAGQFAEQLLGYLRDLMAVAVGCGPELLKVCNPSNMDQIKQLADGWGLQSILAAVQLLDEALVRMRFSVQSQALFEVALVQISQLQDLATIAQIIEAVQKSGRVSVTDRPSATSPGRLTPMSPSSGQTSKSASHVNSASVDSSSGIASSSPPPVGRPSEKKKVEALDSTASSSHLPPQESAINRSPPPVGNAPRTIAIPADSMSPSRSLSTSTKNSRDSSVGTLVIDKSAFGPVATTSANSSESQQALRIWQAAAMRTEGMLADFAARAIEVECQSNGQWTIVFPAGSGTSVEYCESPVRKAELHAALKAEAGHELNYVIRVQPGTIVRTSVEVPVSSAVARSQRMRQLLEHPYISLVCELLQGEIIRIDPPQPVSTPHIAEGSMPFSKSL